MSADSKNIDIHWFKAIVKKFQSLQFTVVLGLLPTIINDFSAAIMIACGLTHMAPYSIIAYVLISAPFLITEAILAK